MIATYSGVFSPARRIVSSYWYAFDATCTRLSHFLAPAPWPDAARQRREASGLRAGAARIPPRKGPLPSLRRARRSASGAGPQPATSSAPRAAEPRRAARDQAAPAAAGGGLRA